MRRWRAALVRGLRRAEGGRLRQPRLAALFVREALALLAGMDPKAPALRVATISRANLHRHIVVLRFPDQPFYLDAIKGWLARRRIHLLAQQTLVFGLHCDEAGCLLELREPGEGAEENFVLAALHVSASSIEAAELKAALGAVLDGVHASVADFARVQRVLGRAARALK
ncbi:MAG: NAD-glutamate dehydrogenase, partial [Zetaproteobacteria bacterium]